MGRRYPNEYTDTANARIARVSVKKADSGSSRTVQGKSVTSGILHVALVGWDRARHQPPPVAGCRGRQRRMPQSGRRPGVSMWLTPISHLPERKARRRRGTGRASPSVLCLSIHFPHNLNGLVQIGLVQIGLAINSACYPAFPQGRIQQGIETLIAFLPVYHVLPAERSCAGWLCPVRCGDRWRACLSEKGLSVIGL